MKLSFHLRGGFIQFSSLNKGIVVSGRDPATGKPKGLGIGYDGPVVISTGGPLFGLTVWGLDGFDVVSSSKAGLMEFREGDFYHRDGDRCGCRGYFIEVFMLPRQYFRRVYGDEKRQTIKLELPYISLVTFRHELRVLDLPGQDCFLGVMVSKSFVTFPSETGFVLNGPSSRDPETGIFESIAAFYPRPDQEMEEERGTISLDYRAE